jgi:light-harvesting complex I chlorophyll a/b binding protein 5
MAAMQLSVMTSGALSGKALAVRPKASRAQVSTVVRAASQVGEWLPGSKAPAHLEKADLPGNFGFDPLNLGTNPKALAWYQQAELLNGRTAMTAVAGILIPSLLTKAGVLNVPAWYAAGKVSAEQSNIDWRALLFVQFVLSHWVEIKRYEDLKNPGSQAEPGSFLGLESAFKGKEPGYPGGPFDPLGLSDGAQFEEYKLKEIKNGRLAMLAFLGFGAQYLATGKDPVTNLTDHLANPWTANFTTNSLSLPFQNAVQAPFENHIGAFP